MKKHCAIRAPVICVGLIVMLWWALPAGAQQPKATVSESRQLDISFLFHFNQALAPAGPAAAQVAYVGLLEALREHPEMPFQIQISGTLVNNLSWFNERALELIREGVSEGQFEIWGSTYSQNIMYASGDAWTNEQQIRTHRRLLKEVFGVEPEGFWNPERVWTQAFVSLLVRNGYRYTAVEQHILAKSEGYEPGHFVRTTQADGDTLFIVTDDTQFLQRFDMAVASGSADSLLLYLRNIYEADTLDRALVAYFQDAEATGLWQVEGGQDPRTTWRHLDSLLTVLGNQDWLNITTTGRFLSEHLPTEDLTPIADGQADWMITFAREMGYEDWYDYWMNDPAQAHFRPLFDRVRDSLKTINELLSRRSLEHGAAARLFQRAVRTFLVHEYEYGASWYWSRHDDNFNFVRETLVSLLAVRYALEPATRTYWADVNIDGVDEIVMVDPANLYVLTTEGGRLLYWFDLTAGTSLVGNENYNYYTEPYVNGGRYVPALKGGRDVYPWLPCENPWVGNEVGLGICGWTFGIRRRALNDWVYTNGTLIDSLVYRSYEVQLGEGRVRFSYRTDGIALTKTVARDGEQGLSVAYTLRNVSASSQPVEFTVESAFSPSYLNVMDEGRGSLAYWNVRAGARAQPPAATGVRNVNTGALVYYAFEEDPFYVQGTPVVFGLELSPKYVFTLQPGTVKEIHFSLIKHVQD